MSAERTILGHDQEDRAIAALAAMLEDAAERLAVDPSVEVDEFSGRERKR